MTTNVESLCIGDRFVSPISGEEMIVRAVETAPLGMIDVACRTTDDEPVIVTLAWDEIVEVVAPA